MGLFANTRYGKSKRIWILYSYIHDFIQQFYSDQVQFYSLHLYED